MISTANMKWSNLDYLEGARYLALNYTEEEARRSPLRRIIPWRRSNRGTRSGMRGAGPRGRERGDQEQWEFPSVILEEWEKKFLASEVIKIAIKTLFNKHYYTFGGKMYHQDEGGPIGLRATCAIARMVMQYFDKGWEEKLTRLNIKIWLNARYMDDGRLMLPPIKRGWRWEGEKVQFYKRWELEDSQLSLVEVTRRRQDIVTNNLLHLLG